MGLSEKEIKEVEALSPDQIEYAYRIQERKYRVQDAERHVSDAGYAGEFDDSDYEMLADIFEAEADCNRPENEVWAEIVEKAHEAKAEERQRPTM